MASRKLSTNEKPRKLTPKQAMFVDEYLVDLNATQAALRAGYSEQTAYSIGQENLKKPEIASAIQAAADKRSERTQITADKVLTEIGKLAFADIRKLFDDQGRLLPVHMLPEEVAAAISSIEVVTSRIPGTDPVEVEHTSKIRFWDKRGSLELLGKHLKLFGETAPQVNVNVQVATMIRELDD